MRLNPNLFMFSGFIFAGWILSVCFHEFGHAIVAYWGGDKSVKEKGYLTLNPLKYTHPMLSLILPIIFLLLGGIPLPGAAVYINKNELRNRFWQSAVSAAGPLASALFALIFAIPFWAGIFPSISSTKHFFSFSHGDWIPPLLAFLIVLDIYVLLFNLLPIPPLDGYGIIEPWLPIRWQNQLRLWSMGILGCLLALLWFYPGFNRALLHSSVRIASFLHIPLNMIEIGAFLFSSRPLGGLLGFFLLLGLVIYLLRAVRQPRDILVNAWDILAFFMLQLKLAKFALFCLDQALAIKPDAYEVIWMNRGKALGVLKRYEEAIACYDYIIEHYPNYQETEFDQGIHQVWMARGNCLYHLKRYHDAIVSYDETLKLKPDQVDGWLLRGISLSCIRKYNEALDSYEKVLEKEPNHASAWSLKGDSLRLLKRHNEAISAYEKALTLKPNDPAILSDRALLLRDLKRNEEALSDYNKILRMNPNLFPAKQGKAWTLIFLQRESEALDFVEKLLKKEPERIEFLNIKAIALSHLQQDEDAIATYDQAIALKPNEALTWYNKACHFAKRNEIDPAIFCLQEALKFNPEWVKINLTKDTDFDIIREDLRFQNLLAE